MILPLVAELLARVGRRPAVEAAFESLRGGKGVFRLSGLTNPAKALIAALAVAALDRPAIFLVESNQRAEELFGVLWRQWIEPNLSIVGLVRPMMVILGSIVH